MPRQVYDAVTKHLELEKTIGGYEAEHGAQANLQAFYTEFSTLLSASTEEISYVENAMRA